MFMEVWRNGRRGQAIHDGKSWMSMLALEKRKETMDSMPLLLRCCRRQ